MFLICVGNRGNEYYFPVTRDHFDRSKGSLPAGRVSIDITRGFIAAVILLAIGRDQVKIQRPFRRTQVSSVEQLIDMLALLKEVSRFTIMVNFSRKLEGNNGRKGRNFARKFAANYREERIIARKFAAKYHVQRIFARKFAGLKQWCRENAAKYRRNFVCITFAQYCRSARIITCCIRSSKAMNHLRWSSLSKRRSYHKAKLVFLCPNSLAPSYFLAFFIRFFEHS